MKNLLGLLTMLCLGSFFIVTIIIILGALTTFPVIGFVAQLILTAIGIRK
jgi:hypothetical protein